MANAAPVRVPPNDLDAEAAVLCAMLMDPTVLDALDGAITPADFYSDANRAIFQEALSLRGIGQPVDALTVMSALRDAGKLERIGGAPYLAQISDATPAVAHVEGHARIVSLKAQQRRLVSTCERYAAEGYGNVGDVAEWAQGLEREVFEAAHGGAQLDPAQPMSELAPAVLADTKARKEAGGVAPGLDTGWRDLTKAIGGWEDSLVYVVAGRPGMGKSALLLAACLNVAKTGEMAVFVSAEMPKDQLASRALATESNISVSGVRAGKVTQDEYYSLTLAADRLKRWPLWLDFKQGATIGAIRSSIRKAAAAAKKKPRIIAIDYLQILTGQRGKGENRESEVAWLMRQMLSIAAEFKCPVLVGSQLNRGVESRAVKEKRPALGDLRESGAIEQDAYGVLMLYRDEYYHQASEDRGVLEVIIAKNRNGGAGTVRLHFTADSTRISNLAGEFDDYGDNP
jgi:replicative DNA helicase